MNMHFGRTGACLLVALVLVACGGSGAGDDGSAGALPEPVARPRGTAEIGPAGGRVEGVDGASVSVPAGALEVTATVSIARDATDAPPAPNGMRTLGNIFAVTPHGARFVQPVQVTIPFDVQALPAGRKPALLKVSPGKPWQVIENVTVNDSRITASVDSLSWFQPISVPSTGFGVANPNPTAPPPSNVPSYQLSFENSNWGVLQATGVNATLVQQPQPAEPARIRSSIHVPADADLVQTCDASFGTVKVSVNRVSAVTYRRPADPVAGTNRVALDFNVTEPWFIQAGTTTAPVTTLLEVSAVDARWNPPPPDPYNALLGMRASSLPPDGIVAADAPGWQVEVQVDCMPQNANLFARPLWSLQPSVQPIVVLRAFAPARIGIAQQPVSTALLDGQWARLEAAAVVSQPNDQIRVSTDWERAEAGSNSWAVIPPRPAGSAPPANGLYHFGTVGVPARLEGAVRAATDNGARFRARLCLPASANAPAECSTSRPATLTVSTNFPAPRFTTPPRSQTLQSGQTLALFVEFEGFPLPRLVTWQTRTADTEAWQDVDRSIWRNSVRPESITFEAWGFLSRAEDRLVSTRPLTVADRGRQFRAAYTTVAGTATSTGATINVTTGQTPPRLTAQPQDITVTGGQTAVFAAAADGAAPLSYQWLLNGQRIQGANAPTLALGSVNAGNAGLYALEVSNVEATVRSQAARLSVTGNSPPPAVAPTITTAPLSQTVAAGGSATLAVVAAGTAPISYQWIRDGNFIAGATSPVLTLSNLGAGDSGSFAVLVFNAAGSITSSAATLTVQTVQPPVTQAPSITTQPTGQVLTLGQRAVFAVAVSGGAPLSYRWERDGSALQGADGAVLVINAVGTADAGNYRVTVSNAVGSASSNAAGLVVLPPPGAPTITGQPASTTALAGNTATFRTDVGGSPAPQCLWLRNGIAIAGANDCSGYTTPPTTQGDNGTVFNLFAYNAGGFLFAQGAVLTVQLPTVPAFTTQPSSVTVTTPAPAVFSLQVAGNPTPALQWQVSQDAGSTWADVPGATSATLTVSPSSVALSNHRYRAVATNSAGAITSGEATLTVSPVATSAVLFAGTPGTTGSADGIGMAARFNSANYLAANSAGTLYVGDFNNHTVRAITPAAVVSTLAGGTGVPGFADGMGAAARFNGNGGLAVDSAGNIFVADWDNFVIRRITPAGAVSTLAGSAGLPGSGDGTGAAARFSNVNGMAFDASDNLYVADWGNQTIRRITPAGVVTTLAGRPGFAGSADGAGAAARFNLPTGVAVDAAGNVFVSDQGNHTIRRITPAGVVTTVAGQAGSPGSADGPAATARLSSPAWLTISPSGDLFVTSGTGETIRKLTPAGEVSTAVGVAGQSSAVVLGADPRLRNARGVLALSSNQLLVAADNAIISITLP